MTSTATHTAGSTAAVLDGLRAKTAEIANAEVEKAELSIEGALLNEADPAACVGFFAVKALPLAGPGAPLVSEFAFAGARRRVGDDDRVGVRAGRRDPGAAV